MRRSLALSTLALLALAAPAGAEVFFVTLNNGTTFETAYQPQAASWDTGMVLLLTETGNWIGLPQADIKEVRSESQIAGYGQAIDDNTFELGFAPNDASDPNAAKPADAAEARALMLEQMVNQQQQELNQRQTQESYTIQQFVNPGQLQGIPARLIGNSGGPSAVNPNQ